MLVILRHGESTLNAEDRFSGWADCPLTPVGLRQAHDAGRALRKAGVSFGSCFTSVLSRARDTAAIVLGEMGLADIPVAASWQLNERHYGILEGVPKSCAVAKYGAAQVEAWRNAADAAPPPLAADDARQPRLKTMYSGIATELLPSSECLRAAFKRVTGYFDCAIRPLIESGESVLVVSHGNPVRAMIAHLQGLPDGEIPAMEISNTAPVVYQAGNSGRLVRVPWTVNTANHGMDGMSKW